MTRGVFSEPPRVRLPTLTTGIGEMRWRPLPFLYRALLTRQTRREKGE